MDRSKEFTVKLPEDTSERQQVLDTFGRTYNLVSLVDNIATFTAKPEPQLEMHPVTHLPILND
jgi:hypothetical protein